MFVPQPREEELTAFWTRAKTRSKLAEVPGVMGMTDTIAVEPPAFAFGDGTRELASELANLVVSGNKTVTTSYAPAYDATNEAYPRTGDLAILLDGEARPVALLRNRKVEVVPFNEINDEIAKAEGEGSLEQWIAEHTRVFTSDASALGLEFSQTANIIVEHFDVMYRVDTDLS
ncbi:ASCH domain-containing protein [Arcanobacterium buesumense]|uniref:ASCH domain-containing protein n=1 Tax=Arcanobacterium buesumense TaxID=2722751 RepID=A0A6H2EN27_9ACTO|nr:ASCH domain-containing protein [Arcanobacterium buesumense]QJC22479.1 ASCH domain-containing protein [Arcanobacterium buesumense]